MSEMERLAGMLRWSGELLGMRFHQVESAHPGAPRHELYALWTEAMYRGSVPDDLLQRTLAEIRHRGEHRLAPYGRDE